MPSAYFSSRIASSRDALSLLYYMLFIVLVTNNSNRNITRYCVNTELII